MKPSGSPQQAADEQRTLTGEFQSTSLHNQHPLRLKPVVRIQPVKVDAAWNELDPVQAWTEV